MKNFILLISIFTCLVSCKENNENKNLDLHTKLQSLSTEIEIHIINNELDSAKIKLPKLVHPSSKLSPVKFETDLTTKKGWSDALNRNSSNISYSEYWNAERERLLKQLKDKSSTIKQ